MVERFTMDNPNDWGFPITDNVTGKVYNCASNILMKELCVVVNTIVEENEQLKKVLGAILLEVKQDISNTHQTGEIRAFINPNSFDLISEVLRKYGALKEWYE